MKIGDKVMLLSYEETKEETKDWSKEANIPLNVPLIVEGFSSAGKWINFKGYRLNHPPEKFIPYTETKTENKMENCKIYVPTPILSELVQKKLFKSGIKWNSGDQNVRKEWDTLEVHDGRIAAWNYLKEETMTAKEVLGNFDWCLNYGDLPVEQQKQYCKFRGYDSSPIGFQYYGWQDGWDCNNYSWGTVLDWESFVHLYLDVKEAIPQVEEEYSQIKQSTMKSQYLTRDELITLLNQFDCPTWKNEIKKLLTGHEYSTGDTKIDVTASISKLISEGTANQKSAVQALGIVLVADKSVTIPEFPAIFNEYDKMLEVRCSENPEFSGKSFYLGRDFNWEIKNDGDCLCLVPTKK